MITGPKSLITLLEMCSKLPNTEIKFLIESNDDVCKIGKFPFETDVIFFNNTLALYRSLKTLSQETGNTVVVFDRANIIHPLIIAKLFRWKTCLRLLGRANRLNSGKIFSYRILVKIVTFFLPVDLVLETIDGSQKTNQPICRSHKYISRFNGIPELSKYNISKKNSSLFVNVGRFSPEKDIVSVINAFSEVRKIDHSAKLHIFGVTLAQFLSLGSTEKDCRQCTFHGFATSVKIFSYLSEAKYFITGNTVGLLGNAETEAIGFGCTILNATTRSKFKLPSELRHKFISLYDFKTLKSYHHSNSNPYILTSFKEVHLSDTNYLISLFCRT